MESINEEIKVTEQEIGTPEPARDGQSSGLTRVDIQRPPSGLVGDQANVTVYTTGLNVEQNEENKSLQARIIQIEELCRNLKQEIVSLKAENMKLRNNRGNTPSKQTEYFTDEEDLSRETDWILKKNKRVHKKRKAESSPEILNEPLEDKIEGDVKKTSKRESKPPPVIISNLANYNVINKALESKNLKFKANIMNNKQVKINVETDNEYRELTKWLNEAKIEWHTYENKQNRPIRVMVRGLHPTCDPKDIMVELANKGFDVLDVVNKIKKYKNEEGKEYITRLPLFMMTFNNMEEIKKIYEIQFLHNLRVKIEPLKSGRLIPQCKRCQSFGHTQKFCQRKPMCVKCAEPHLTADCKKAINTQPKCSNCKKDHPANYRGCVIAKELQKRRNLNRKQKEEQTSQPKSNIAKRVPGVTYAQTVQISNEKTEINQKKDNGSIEELLKKLTSNLEKFEENQKIFNNDVINRLIKLESSKRVAPRNKK